MAQLCTFAVAEIRKDFYMEHPSVARQTIAEAEAFRQAKQITVEGVDIPNPIRKFSESSLPEYMLKTFKEEGFTQPSPIQCQGWPAALAGRDLIGVAETGSGKTLAFLLPALLHIEAQPPLARGDGPVALVLTPTRELAQQIQQQFDRYRRRARMSCVYGGTPRGPQQRELTSGVEAVVATPGRFQDFLLSRTTNTRRVSYLVLDEADKMLAMGLGPTVAAICADLRPDRQTLMFTATWGPDVQALASQYLSRDCLKVKVGAAELAANHNIHQTVQVVPDEQKADHFIEILKAICRIGSKILVFTTTKAKAESLTKALLAARYLAAAIHGDKSQADRDRALADFKAGRVPLVVATDVAARGLDIPNVEYVVNFDLPTNIESYIHRIGRTGRAGSHGKSISFFCEDDEPIAHDLVQVLQEAGQRVDPQLWEFANRARAKLASKEGRDTLFVKRRNRFSQRAEPYDAQLVSKIASGTMERPVAKNLRSSVGEPSDVLLLRNVVSPSEVDADLPADIEGECSKFGTVRRVYIHEVTHWSIREAEAVRIFVQFDGVESASTALRALNGRQFGGRVVCCSFFPSDRFRVMDLEPSPKDPAMPHCLLLRNMATAASLDDQLEADVRDECGLFGEVVEVAVHVVRGVPSLEQVRVFVRFAKAEACVEALGALHGRRFAGRVVYACFWDEALLERRELGPCPLEPPMLLPRMAPAQTPTPDPTPPPRPAPASSVTSRGVLSTGPLLSQPTASKPHFTEATAGGIVADY